MLILSGYEKLYMIYIFIIYYNLVGTYQFTQDMKTNKPNLKTAEK